MTKRSIKSRSEAGYTFGSIGRSKTDDDSTITVIHVKRRITVMLKQA